MSRSESRKPGVRFILTCTFSVSLASFFRMPIFQALFFRGIYSFWKCVSGLLPYHPESARSRLISGAKQGWSWLVLGWKCVSVDPKCGNCHWRCADLNSFYFTYPLPSPCIQTKELGLASATQLLHNVPRIHLFLMEREHRTHPCWFLQPTPF